MHEGVVHLVYFAGDPKHGDVFYTRSDNFGDTFSPPVRVNSQEASAIAMGTIRGDQISVGKRNRVHVSWKRIRYRGTPRTRGETLLTWVEGSGWQRGGVLSWQIFDPKGRPSVACEVRQSVPVWSFPAVFVRPDEGFTIVV